MYFCSQIINQVFMLLKELCRLYQVEEPANLDSLRLGVSQQFCLISDKPKVKSVEEDEDEDEDDDDLEEDIPLANEETDNTNKNKVITVFEKADVYSWWGGRHSTKTCMLLFFLAQNEDMKTEYIEILERLKNKQRCEHMKGSITGSVQANNRLMKELRDIYNSDTFKKGIH